MTPYFIINDKCAFHELRIVRGDEVKKKHRLFLLILFGFLVVIGFLFFVLCNNGIQTQAITSFKWAPTFSLKNHEGKGYRLSDFKGSYTLIHFWASWCPPCLKELPRWVEFSKHFEDEKLHWVAVSVDKNWEDAQKVFSVGQMSSNLVLLLDPENHVPEKYGTYQFPETFLLSKDLKIITRWVGDQEWGSQAMETLLRKLIQQ